MSLFQHGGFTLHSGGRSAFRIDCDALTDEDWQALAHMIADRVGAFSAVVGVPRGGLKLAEALRPLVRDRGVVLVVDDVLTTDASMEAAGAEAAELYPCRTIVGAVVFARTTPPSWVMPLFTLWPVSADEHALAALEAITRLMSAWRDRMSALDRVGGKGSIAEAVIETATHAIRKARGEE